MPDSRAVIRAVLAACSIDPPVGFVWFGRRIRVAQHGTTDAEGARKRFLLALAGHLYDRVYCQGEATPFGAPAAVSGAGEVRALMTALSGAHHHPDRWDTGWTAVERKEDQWVVRKWDLDFTVAAECCRPHQSERLRAGSPAEVLVPAERWFEYPGYMLFYGQRIPTPSAGTAGLTRLYLNLDDEGARRMIDMCGTFDDLALPFTLKVAGYPEEFDRCDTVVLFVERRDYGRASETIAEVAGRFRSKLRPGVPAFVEPLAPGVGVADGPPGGGSFGESRCRLLGEGIVLASELGGRTVEARLRVVENRFREEGISLDRAHLNPASADYEPGPWSRWSNGDAVPGSGSR